MLPSISLVTPSYNQNKYLEETIHSVVSQEYPNLEYIIMDGGSNDGSLDTIKKYESHLACWETGKDDGQYDAVQKGFERSTGEIMGYLNSDDLYFPWTLRVVGEIFAAFPQIDWLTTSRPCATGASVFFPIEHTHHNWSHRWFLATRGKLLESRGFIQQEATFWRRSLWEKTGRRLNTALHYAGDFELWSRFYLQAIPVTVDMPLAMFRVHKEQKTARQDLYISEANQILSNYPRPMPVPPLLIRILNKIYQRTGSNSNWLGARCDQVIYNLQKEIWVYQKNLEWRDFHE
jgi:hypothetical protein